MQGSGDHSVCRRTQAPQRLPWTGRKRDSRPERRFGRENPGADHQHSCSWPQAGGRRRTVSDDGGQVLELASGRCGDAEHAHSALKSELAGGTLPCGRLRANAAWWQGAILAMNLHAWVRHCAFDGNLRRAQWKRVRAVVLIHDRTYRKARRIVLIADNHVIHKSGITGRCLASNPKFELVFQRVL